MLNGKTILVTGGTGSFGNAFTQYVLENYEPKKIIIYSRDEYKQFVMGNKFRKYKEKLRFFIGDVRDGERMRRAFDGVDYVVHAAALKQVPACEYNPMEAVKTNINGAMNIVDAALDCGVKRVVALSTDKAVNPINLYGGTKLVSDKLFVAANAYSGAKDVCFSIVRYGNVAGSRGSVIPFFRNIIAEGKTKLPITDYRMTRFWISLEEGVTLVILPGCEMPEVGIREGENLQEIMVTREDSMFTYEYENHFIVYPHFEWWQESRVQAGGKLVEPGFEYSSGTNTEWLSVEEIAEKLKTVSIH